MGNRKQKWTPEEVAALLAGIAKHGHSKWIAIKEDPEFVKVLGSRSNIDLKDKWRNIYKNKGRISKPKPSQDAPPTPSVTSQPPAALPVPVVHQSLADHVMDDSADDLPNARKGPRYDEMIFEALSAVKEQVGLDIGSIVAYIEQRIEVPQNFRRQLGERLRRLVQRGKLDKVDGIFSLKNNDMQTNASNQKDGWSRQHLTTAFLNADESLPEAAKTAVYKVFEAENLSYLAADSVEEAEKMLKMAEETDSILQLSKWIFDRCTGGEILLVHDILEKVGSTF